MPPPPGASMPPPSGPGGPKKGLSGGAIAAIIVGVVVILGLLGGLLVVLTSDDAAADEVFLEPAGSTTADPFTASVSEGDEDGLDNQASENPAGTVSNPGDEPGLYGGTQDAGTCDRDQLVAFLDENPSKAAAWARVQGIPVDDIADFVDDLTPVRLRTDTRVTNHGYVDGTANPIQAVLQAGTAVLVDDTGLPRVKCSCGNPLVAPSAASNVDYVGSRWTGFSPTAVETVVSQTTVDVFVLVDLDTGERFERPVGTNGDADQAVSDDAATTTTAPSSTTTTTEQQSTTTTSSSSGLGTGDVQITLSWDTDADLDLYVTDPDGEQISFSNPSASSGGELDVDDIPSCGDTSTHVENVFWPTNSAPTGDYEILVDNRGGCSGAPTSFTLDVYVGGGLVDTQSGTLGDGDQSSTLTLTVS